MMQESVKMIFFLAIDFTCGPAPQPCQVGLMVSVSASQTVGHEFASRPGHPKDHHKNGTDCNALGKESDSAAQLSKRPVSVWNCLWGHALKRSPGIIRKSKVSYPGPGFLSSATWPSLPKKHYNGLIKINQIMSYQRLSNCLDACQAVIRVGVWQSKGQVFVELSMGTIEL